MGVEASSIAHDGLLCVPVLPDWTHGKGETIVWQEPGPSFHEA